MSTRTIPSRDPLAAGAARDRRMTDGAVALGLAAVAGVVYGFTVHVDWSYDPLSYASLIRSDLGHVVHLQHALGTLLPLLGYRVVHAFGYAGSAVPMLAAFSVAGACAAVGLTYLAARRLGASATAAAAAAAVLGATAVVWRAGGSAGVYGVAFGAAALAWVAAARYVRRPDASRAGALGVAAGVALAAHLASLAFVPAALVLVAGVGGEPGARRARRVVTFIVAFGLAGGALLLVAAGIAAGFSPSGMLHWLTHPGIAKPGDRSYQVGWGASGLWAGIAANHGPTSWLDGLSSAAGAIWTVLVAGTAVGVLRGLRLVRARGVGRIVAAALLLHAGLAFAAAAGYQPLRAEYFGLGFVPLAILAALGSPSRPVARRRRRVVAAGAAALVVALAVWNFESDVLPTLRSSHDRSRAVAAIEGSVPSGSRILVSLFVAGRLLDDGYRAASGWIALQATVGRGEPKPGLDPALRGSGGPLFVSSRAFDLQPAQAAFLGTTSGELWASIRACCDPRPVLTFTTAAGPETLYRVTVPPG